MNTLKADLDLIKGAAKAVGLVELSKRAGVPCTTVRSFATNDWKNRSLPIFYRLRGAAAAIMAEERTRARRAEPVQTD